MLPLRVENPRGSLNEELAPVITQPLTRVFPISVVPG